MIAPLQRQLSSSRTVLREQVKEVLLERILRGELKPGDRLVETRIAQELGTSQAPVREALRDLELLGLVESEPFRGSRVREVSDEELLDVFPVRAVLEELAAKEAARRLGGDVSALEAELAAMLEGGEAGDTADAARVRHRLPPRARRGGREPRAAAGVARARRRGADRVRRLLDVLRRDGARRVPRLDHGGNPSR